MNKSNLINLNRSTQQMSQVVLPNSTENATLNDLCSLKIVQVPE